MMKKSMSLLFVLLTMAALLLTGCAKTEETPTVEAQATEEVAAEAPADGGAAHHRAGRQSRWPGATLK